MASAFASTTSGRSPSARSARSTATSATWCGPMPTSAPCEPTETESKRTLDEFADAMLAIAREAQDDPEVVKTAPHSTPVKRLDEVRAARQPDLRWRAR